ncbi:ABC transporter permease [[Clostridium] polysaccharolyticum]|uniref:Transport permease protein n=1 Tax=[Clostridium] polysaccharolyticum TaxID=29364 RepID=A0A1H9Z7L2_9FIRM|nr:ABC transporter permease [[Clostridium] polysaccharolyticum]SES77565.1 ABC-2 type transport system permease protein [[Clostridium] polysaccharolyticum]
MKRKALLKLTTFEFKLFFRNFINVFFLLLFPTMMILMFGGIYGNKPQDIYHGFGMVDVSVPAYAGMIISVTGLMNLPLTLCEYREKKILKRFKATPVSPSNVISAQLAVNFFMTIVGMILLIVISRIVFHLNFQGSYPAVILVFVLSVFSVFSIGFLIASLAPNMKAGSAIANIVYFPMLFMTGATVPLEIMPKGMQQASKFFPVTHVVKAMQGAWLNKDINDYLVNIIVLLAITVICFGISIVAFRWE